METTEVEDDLPPDGDADDARANRDRSGIQSIEVGTQLLVALTHAMRAMVAAVAGATRYASKGAASDRCSAWADSRTTTGFAVLHSIASCVT